MNAPQAPDPETYITEKTLVYEENKVKSLQARGRALQSRFRAALFSSFQVTPFFFITLVTGPGRSLRLTLSDTRVFRAAPSSSFQVTHKSMSLKYEPSSEPPPSPPSRSPFSSLLLARLELGDTQVYAP